MPKLMPWNAALTRSASAGLGAWSRRASGRRSGSNRPSGRRARARRRACGQL